MKQFRFSSCDKNYLLSADYHNSENCTILCGKVSAILNTDFIQLVQISDDTVKNDGKTFSISTQSLTFKIINLQSWWMLQTKMGMFILVKTEVHVSLAFIEPLVKGATYVYNLKDGYSDALQTLLY